MAFTLEQLRNQYEYAIDKAWLYIIYSDTDRNFLAPKFGAYMDADAEDYFDGMMENLYDCLKWTIGYSYQYTIKVLIAWMELAEEELGGAEIDMDAIINAMLQAEPAQIEKFIGLIEAYQMSLWNKPFNYEFYAALARGFV